LFIAGKGVLDYIPVEETVPLHLFSLVTSDMSEPYDENDVDDEEDDDEEEDEEENFYDQVRFNSIRNHGCS